MQETLPQLACLCKLCLNYNQTATMFPAQRGVIRHSRQYDPTYYALLAFSANLRHDIGFLASLAHCQETKSMANSLSAKKRIRQNIKRRAQNRWRKNTFRTAIKTYRETLLHGTVEQAQSELQMLYKLLDQVAGKGTIHKNTAARYKSRLALRLEVKKTAQAA